MSECKYTSHSSMRSFRNSNPSQSPMKKAKQIFIKLTSDVEVYLEKLTGQNFKEKLENRSKVFFFFSATDTNILYILL